MNIREIQTMVEGIVPVLREYIDKSVERSATAIQTVTDGIREENRALKAELMELRSTPTTALATISESDEHEVVENETDSLEMWDGWFARDSLAIVREAQALELRTVQDVVAATRSAEYDTRTHDILASIGETLAAVATREPPPTVVNVAPAEVHVSPPAVNVTVEAPKPSTRTMVINKPGGETVTATVEEK